MSKLEPVAPWPEVGAIFQIRGRLPALTINALGAAWRLTWVKQNPNLYVVVNEHGAPMTDALTRDDLILWWDGFSVALRLVAGVKPVRQTVYGSQGR